MSVLPDVKALTENKTVTAAPPRATFAARVAFLALVGSHLNYLVLSILYPGYDRQFEGTGISVEFFVGGLFLFGSFLLYMREGCPRIARRRVDFSLAALVVSSAFISAGILHNSVPARYVVTVATCVAYFWAARFLAAFYMPKFAALFKDVWLWITPPFLLLLAYLYLSGRFVFQIGTMGFPQPYIFGGVRPTEVALLLSLQIICLNYCLQTSSGKGKRILLSGVLTVLVLLLLWMQSLAALLGMAMVIAAYFLFVSRHKRTTAALIFVGFILAAFILFLNPSTAEPLLQRVGNVAAVKQSDLTRGEGTRAIMYSALVDLAKANPLYGIGKGKFAADGYMFTEYGSLGPHNLVLGIAAESGIPAAITHIFYILSVLALGVGPFLTKRQRRLLSKDTILMQFQFAALACFGFCQWRGLSHDTGDFKEVYFWAGIVVGMSYWRLNSRPKPERKLMMGSGRSSKPVVPRRVAAVVPFGRLDHYPGMFNAINCFADYGYQVDVFALRNVHYKEAQFKQDSIKVRYLPFKFRAVRESRAWATLLFMLWLPFVLKKDYIAVYTGGLRGLLACWAVSRFRKLRIINHQLELLIGPRLQVRFARCFKWFERTSIQKCFASLEHDETRAALLCEDAQISRDRVIIVPNAPRGEGRVRRSRFLADKFGLSQQTRVLLSAGSLGRAYLSEETVAAAQTLPQNWVCIVHSAYARDPDDPYLASLKTANSKGKTFFSLDPVPYEQLPDILCSADIGLALYGDVGGPNTTEVGLASGKLCHFLQHGVPIIVSDVPMLRAFVEKHRVGVAVGHLDEIPSAIAAIMADYDGYSLRAAETFTRELAYQSHFKKLLDRLDEVVPQ